MPGRHPDDDVLADLAADVLPADEARAVEAHVLGCDRCARLLEDAEHVRGLLLAGDPGPVPDDVWRRIESALAAETMPGRGSRAAERPSDRAADRPSDRAADTAAFQAFVDAPTAPARVVPLPAPPPDEVDDADPGWGEDADPLDDPARWTGDRGRRIGRGTASRREARDPEPRRRGPLLLAAAAAVAVVAVVGTVRLADRGSNSEASLTAGGAAASSSAPASGAGESSAAGSVPIVASGRTYRQSTLATEAKSLLGAGTADGGLAPASSPSRGSAAPQKPPVPTPSAPGAGTSDARSLAADPKADDLRNPARLAACLGALGVSPDRLVAVDLATYDGREAAILLATSADGAGHEVWAVERTCGPGAEGALGYTRLRD